MSEEGGQMPLLDKWNIMGVQLKSGPGGAGNTVIPGPNHCEGVAMASVPQEKECSRCGERKVLGDFYRSSASRDGRQSYCKTCKKEAYAQYASETRRRFASLFGGGRRIAPSTEASISAHGGARTQRRRLSITAAGEKRTLSGRRSITGHTAQRTQTTTEPRSQPIVR